MSENSNVSEGIKVVQTDVGAKDGQNKCPKCGATEISLNTKTGKLRCNFCRHEFEPEKVEGLETDISKLEGNIIGSGAQDIVQDTNDVVTFKCESCGAEVVIDTSEVTQARCHWCRNTLSVNEQIPNGSIPDAVLPFKLTKAEARTQIESFVNKRRFFANTQFKQEFTTENIMGVYFPYMVVDINSHVSLKGKGERLVRSYTRGSDENKRRYYDADLYKVERYFDLTIKGLTVESSSDKLKKSESNTNNVINAIMPFDTENCVKWDANYSKGYSSEKRDMNATNLSSLVGSQSKDVARFAANDTLIEYNRGVKWEQEKLEMKGTQWKAAYLPVWLYSYQEVKRNKKVLHYVAVNARTKETMGSIPIHMPKLLLISTIIEIIGVILALIIASSSEEPGILVILLMLAGLIYFGVMYSKYRNKGARHFHETETEKEVSNMSKIDELIKHQTGLTNSSMNGANNMRVNGTI